MDNNFLHKNRVKINTLIRSLDAMPLVLRLTCVSSFVVGLGVLVCTIPGIGMMRINGETFSAHQLWSEGYGPFLALSGMAMVISGVGLYRHWGWSRWIVVFLYVIAGPIEKAFA